MYFIENDKNGRQCVSNCGSVGLFYDSLLNMCVGCHPACESCFGPSHEECYQCADGFV